jgi:acetyltransferase
LELAGARVLIQKTIAGRELIFGLDRDPAFGPVVMFGIGGTLVEALKDVTFAVAPVTQIQAERTIRSIRAVGLLGAFRGQAAVDLSRLAKLLSAFAQMGLDLPDLAEVDLNPVVVDASEAAAVDILIKLRETHA